ncbi:hypothetical protein [Kribbella sp. NPDC051770]|uniref:hypothetical protein n=1 Tax=Kribbella sp. NPDC051770 TaxID=3155413 RepID=UPI003417C312
MTRYVGLGRHCESTYQLRRITGVEQANYFDWLDLDHRALVGLLARDFDGVLLDVVPDDEGQCALDRDTGVRYYHDFSSADAIAAELPAVREKYAFLAERWRAMVASGEQVVYVLQDALDEISVDDLQAVRAVLPSRAEVLWIRRTPLPGAVVITTQPGRWEGDDRQWDQLLT